MQDNTAKNNLCILIPTFERSDAINYYLESRLDIIKDCCFDLVIYDSSRDALTENIVKGYMKKGYGFLNYVHYKDSADDFLGDKKIRAALKDCAEKYEYVWLCGDTTVLQIENYWDELKTLLKNKYDVIHIYKNNMGMESRQDIDYREFFRCFFWSMTHWCSFILSGRVVKDMDKWMEEYLKSNYGTAVVCSVFAVLPGSDFKIAYVNHNVYKYSPYRKKSTGHTTGEILKAWTKYIDVGVDLLPNEYEEFKSFAKKSITQNIGLFSWQGAVDLRADGNLDLKKMRKYGGYLKHMTDVPIAWFYLWGMVPRKIAKKFSYAYIQAEEEVRRLSEMDECGARIVIYGAGEHGLKILEKIKYIYKGIRVIAVSDKNWTAVSKEYYTIPPDEIGRQDFDYLGIAIVNRKIYREVRKKLIGMGVKQGQIFHI